MILTIDRYLQCDQYGFFVEEPYRFRISQFHSLKGDPIPPIPGEKVEVFFEGSKLKDVLRIQCAVPDEGDIVAFDPLKGFGYIRKGNERVFLHACEILNGKAPGVGQRVRYYKGVRLGKVRACYATILPSLIEELYVQG